MEITLEKIELVKDRTGATYNEAKEALEAANGSVVDAIIAIEEDINKEFKNEFNGPLFHKFKEMGEKMDINNVVDKAKEYYDKLDKEKVAEYADKAVELGKKGVDVAMEKGKELYELGMEKAEEYQVKEKAMDLIDKIGEKASELKK